MELQYIFPLGFSFAEVCQMGMSSYYPSCQRDGYRADTVRHMSSGRRIFFGVGQFDDFAVYVGQTCPDGVFRCGRPSDKYYFDILRNLGEKYGNSAVYADVEYIFHRTTLFRDASKNVVLSDAVIEDIKWLARHYSDGDDVYWAEEAFFCVYYGMVAEENKRNSQLGAAVKLNGVHKILKQGVPVSVAADCNRGVDAVRIYDECVANHIFVDFP